MNLKKSLRIALLAFAFGSLVYAAGREYAGRREATSNATAIPATGASPSLIVYYFSQGKECVTCDRIEEYTREALDTYFADDLAAGTIAWRAIDVDDPRNEHYITEYEIYTKSIVLVALKDGKQAGWKNLERIWDLIYDKPAFVEYVRSQIQEFMVATS